MSEKNERKIDKIKLIQMRRDGKSVRECAETFGVTPAAIRRMLIRIDKQLSIVPKSDDSLGDHNIDSMRQLNHINTSIINQLEKCNLLLLREDLKVKEVDELALIIESNPDDKESRTRFERLCDSNMKSTLAIQNNIISISGEVRKQIELQLKIAESLYNIQMMAEFQNEVVSIIKEVEPSIAAKLITKLKERRTLRGLVKL